jgi:DNA mismatch repair ATPase MutL
VHSFQVLRALGCFSQTTIVSRHRSYRQSYTLLLSPAAQTVTPSSSARATVGTTVSVKNLFANYPVRQASLRPTRQSEISEIIKMTLGIGLTDPVSISVRNVAGDLIVRVPKPEGRAWERTVLIKGLTCEVSPWREFDGRDGDVRLSVKMCPSTASRSSTFVCISSSYQSSCRRQRRIHPQSLSHQ